MINVVNKYLCCGCTACEFVCKVKAITFVKDALGFAYPQVNKAICVNCGYCNNVCPFYNKDEKINSISDSRQRVFAVRHNDSSEIATSRSGAAFIALSDSILQKGGVIYGAAMDNNFATMHKRSENRISCKEFKGSKYTQSSIHEIIPLVINDLKGGRIVLFSGTPCQIHCINKVVPQKLQDNLITVDIICHGVASPKVWDDYLHYIEKKEKKKIIQVNFRDKEIFGWSGLHKESFTFENNVKQTYHYTFYEPYLLRLSCYNCPFSNLVRHSDITIGDFWGIDKLDRAFNPNDTGCSLVISNTAKGEKTLMNASKDITAKEFSIKDCIQPNLLYPTKEDKRRRDFEKDYTSKGFRYVYHKYGNVGIKYYSSKIKNIITRLWQRYIK